MPRAKAPPRVKGPYTERQGTRFRIRICDEGGQRDLYFSSMQDALLSKEQLGRELPKQRMQRPLRELLDAYFAEQVARGTCLRHTAEDQRARVAAFLDACLDEDVTKLTPKRAAALYEGIVQTPTKKTGQPPAASTHRFYLKLAQSLFRWIVRKGFLPSSPFADVQPVGRVNRGKKQLRFEEATRFLSVGLQMFDEHGDALALASVLLLLLGCRASEALHLRVRDLDCGGTKLWIAALGSDYQGKSRNATRNPEVPQVLQPRLALLAAGKAPDAYLFGTTCQGQPKGRQALHSTVRRICLAAGVPVVCPHSLRGLWATAGVRAGGLSQAVAAALGHGSFSMTQRHYVQPGTLEGDCTDQLVKLLGVQGGVAATPPALDVSALTAQQLAAALPAHTLQQLLQLIQQTPVAGHKKSA